MVRKSRVRRPARRARRPPEAVDPRIPHPVGRGAPPPGAASDRGVADPLFIGGISAPTLTGVVADPLFIGGVSAPTLTGVVADPTFIAARVCQEKIVFGRSSSSPST